MNKEKINVIENAVERLEKESGAAVNRESLYQFATAVMSSTKQGSGLTYSELQTAIYGYDPNSPERVKFMEEANAVRSIAQRIKETLP